MPDDASSRTTDLLARIARLEASVGELAYRYERLALTVSRSGENQSKLWDCLVDERDKANLRIDGAFDRIKNIEIAVFPNLMSDIEEVHKILGGDGVPAEKNPLDSRNRVPRKSDPEQP